MRTIASAAVAALALVGTSAWVHAQSQTPPAAKNTPTKVYSYSQANPTPTATTAPTAQQQQRAPEILPRAMPYGSPKWWEEMLRSSGGEGGQ
jgi:hypothetical protein